MRTEMTTAMKTAFTYGFAVSIVFTIIIDLGRAQGPFDNGLDFIQCYSCADCEWIDPDTTPRCRRPSQNPLVPHSIGYSFPDSLSTRSCIKVIDRDGRVYRGCHNRVARDCVIVENVTACYCEHSLCNGATTARATAQTFLPWLSAVVLVLVTTSGLCRRPSSSTCSPPAAR